MLSLFDQLKVTVPTAVDPSGTGDVTLTGASTWIDTRDYPKTLFYVERVTTATDLYDSMRVQQATDAAGTGAKDVTGCAIGASTLASATLFGQVGDVVTLECHHEALDVAGGFRYLGLVGSLAADGGVNTVKMAVVQGISRYKHRGIATSDHATNSVTV